MDGFNTLSSKLDYKSLDAPKHYKSPAVLSRPGTSASLGNFFLRSTSLSGRHGIEKAGGVNGHSDESEQQPDLDSYSTAAHLQTANLDYHLSQTSHRTRQYWRCYLSGCSFRTSRGWWCCVFDILWRMVSAERLAAIQSFGVVVKRVLIQGRARRCGATALRVGERDKSDDRSMV